MRYQGRGSNPKIVLDRSHGNIYGRCRGRGFNLTKQKVWKKCESLGSGICSIRYEIQAEKYTKTMEVILNYIRGNFNEGNGVKLALEELNHFDFNIIKPKIPDLLPL